MTVISRTAGGAAANPGYAPWLTLSVDDGFLDIARAIDEGWRDIETRAARVAAAEVPRPPVPSTADHARTFLNDPTVDLGSLVADATAATAAAEAATLGLSMLRSAAGIVSDSGIEWIREHVDPLCASIDRYRKLAHRELRAAALGPLAETLTESDFKRNPTAVAAYTAAAAALESWDRWTRVHEQLLAPLTGEPSTPTSAAEKAWPASTWIADYERAWPGFWMRSRHGRQYDGPQAVPDSAWPLFAQSDFGAASDIQRVHTIGRVAETWTPTIRQLSARIAEIDARAYELHQEALAREATTTSFPMYRSPEQPVRIDPITGVRTPK